MKKNYSCISKIRNQPSFTIAVYSKYRYNQKWEGSNKYNIKNFYLDIIICIYNIILDTKASILSYKKLFKKDKQHRNTLYATLTLAYMNNALISTIKTIEKLHDIGKRRVFGLYSRINP